MLKALKIQITPPVVESSLPLHLNKQIIKSVIYSLKNQIYKIYSFKRYTLLGWVGGWQAGLGEVESCIKYKFLWRFLNYCLLYQGFSLFRFRLQGKIFKESTVWKKVLIFFPICCFLWYQQKYFHENSEAKWRKDIIKHYQSYLLFYHGQLTDSCVTIWRNSKENIF